MFLLLLALVSFSTIEETIITPEQKLIKMGCDPLTNSCTV